MDRHASRKSAPRQISFFRLKIEQSLGEAASVIITGTNEQNASCHIEGNKLKLGRIKDVGTSVAAGTVGHFKKPAAPKARDNHTLVSQENTLINPM